MNDFLQTICHKANRDGVLEEANCSAFKMDESDGLAEYLGFNSSCFSRVDYFCRDEMNIQFVELSDLKDDIERCEADVRTLIEEAEKKAKESGKKLSGTNKKKIVKRRWSAILCEFQKKWSGSIAVMERCYRKEIKNHTGDPNYKLLIVCRNGTDVRLLDSLKTRLVGTISSVSVCTTDRLGDHLISR